MLLAFLIVDKHAFSTADIIITYVLLVGAILLEIYAVLVLVTSDWTILWLSNHKNSVVDFFYTTISSIPLSKNERWSNTMGQYNLIKYCLKEKPTKYSVIQKFLCMSELEKLRYQDSAEVSMVLKNLIFEQLQKKSEFAKDLKACKELCACSGDRVLKNAKCQDCIKKEQSKTEEESVEVEFDPVLQMQNAILNSLKETVQQSNRALRKNLTKAFFFVILQQTCVLIMIGTHPQTQLKFQIGKSCMGGNVMLCCQ